MRKINIIYFYYLRREAHYQFLELYNQLLNTFPEAKAIVDIYYDEFIDLLVQEKLLVDAQKSSDYTRLIVAADHQDDRLLVGINSLIDAALHHFDPAVVEAAISLLNRMKPFGNIIRKSYEEEVAAIRILLVDFEGEYANKVEIVGLTPWIKELRISVDEFERLLQSRSSEKAAKPVERLRDIRHKIEIVYREMIDRIDAYNILNENDTCTAFIKELNVQIDYFNEHNHRQVAKDIKTAVVKPIPEQKYTGKPITPIPEVSFEGTELVFAKDFTLSYKNNQNTGNAEIIIHGKGAYRGRKSVTFFIEN
jgi:hypothetical protein